MNISVVTLFEKLYKPFLDTSLVGRAQRDGLVRFDVKSLLDYAAPNKRVDAPTFGPGTGMLLKPEVVEAAIESQDQQHGPSYKIFFSPHGKMLDQDMLHTIIDALRTQKHLLLLPARYEGMDARVESYYADQIISAGNVVLMGGDIPAMMLIEGLLRLIPGVVGKEQSVIEESFTGALVDYPEYTAPPVWKGIKVPEVIRSGNHQEIRKWRECAAAKRSVMHHFDWVRTHQATPEQEKLIINTIPPHYAVLMHTDVLLPGDQVGNTSVTSLDVHDIARSVATYGLKNYFIVTPLCDQQKIIQTLLDFWASPEGIDYNIQRHKALEKVVIVSSLDQVRDYISKKESSQPLLIGSSARASEYFKHNNAITFYDQSKVWAHNQPVLFVLGTGRGLSPSLLEHCDFMVPPIKGYSSFNHLSVRSAAAVVFDRWLGCNIKKYKVH